jgi:DNA-binding XRE family transcriptional regulator
MAHRSYPNLFAYLKHSGRTQTELAHELGISVTMVSMLKWGHRQPTLALALKIADVCHVPLESLMIRKAS